MGRNDFEILIVRKSGPVQSMTIRKWWIPFILIVVLLIGVVMGTGAFMFYRQHQVVSKIAEDTNLLMLRTERLEGLVQEQETKEILVSQQHTPSTPVTPSTPAAPTGEVTAAPPADEPHESSILSIRNVEQVQESGNMIFSFDVVNNQGSSDPAVGYIAVIAYGVRQDQPWVEAWPPMRLNAQGRPDQYRRGTPFSVQYFRTVRARMPIADKQFERVEIVIYSRQGDLLLVSSYPVTKPEQPAEQ